MGVGLPWNEEGNSEIGHLTIGAGKVIYQHFPRISAAIRKGDFFKNEILLKAVEHAKKNNSSVNLIGLLTEGNVHASLGHLLALIKLAKENSAPKINLHLFIDGKDSAPKSLFNILMKLGESPATISGRYYALDRDKHWDRTEKAYNVLTGNGPTVDDLESYVKKYYDRGLSDEFIEPVIVQKDPENFIKDNSAIIFFDFREDSIRQIAESFISPEFDKFPIKKLDNLYIATLTHYSDRFSVPVAFPPETVENPLGKVLADNKKNQLRIAETEKYAHITYFFNGFKDQPMAGEFRVLIPSKNVPRHDEYPEMMASELTGRVLQAIEERGFDFILVNYANPDAIAHTGNFEAALKAIETIDSQIEKLMKAILEQNGAMIITSDHGNAENMVNPKTWLPETKHDSSPVPIYLIGKEFRTRPKTDAEIDSLEKNTVGILSDVAPTILELLGIKKNPEMTGQSLLKRLR